MELGVIGMCLTRYFPEHSTVVAEVRAHPGSADLYLFPAKACMQDIFLQPHQADIPQGLQVSHEYVSPERKCDKTFSTGVSSAYNKRGGREETCCRVRRL